MKYFFAGWLYFYFIYGNLYFYHCCHTYKWYRDFDNAVIVTVMMAVVIILTFVITDVELWSTILYSLMI